MLYLLKGNNEYELKKCLDVLTDELDKDNDLTHIRYEDFLSASERSISEFIAIHALTLPFMGSSRVVVLNRIISRLDKAAEQEIESLITPSLELPPSNHLIFYEPYEEMNKPQQNIFKLFESVLKERSANSSTEVEIIEQNNRKAQHFGADSRKTHWARDYIREISEKYNAPISPEAMIQFALLVGNDPLMLENEMKKLSNFALNREITIDDITALTPKLAEENPFAILDEIIEGNPRRALFEVRQLLQDNDEDPVYLKARITNQIRRLLIAHEAIKNTSNRSEASAQLAESFPSMDRNRFPFKKLLEQAGSVDGVTCRSAIRELVNADRRYKLGEISSTARNQPDVNLELIVLRLSRLFQRPIR
tara:strand:- start:1179 stop:2273 length:1095 start_codon:yes stop_codon:yes gene_type:complete